MVTWMFGGAGPWELMFRMTGLFFGAWAAMIYGARLYKYISSAVRRWIKRRRKGGK